MRLIDADALIRRVKTECNPYGNPTIEFESGKEVCDMIINASIVDAVPVVRCKDCKNRGKDDCPMHITGIPADEELLSELDNDFCSYGERKDGAVMTNSEALECFESDCETCQFKGRDCLSCRTRVAISALRREIKNQSDLAPAHLHRSF